ncbi:GNAT family N-acetyltransferase [Rummeliibacillus sp. TYF005]|uniref:GNAT family N-acetyltransferase n=1 Tax=Rummeliibacillus sp. TYF005 TaxID=2058214 RepID=UPI000F54BC22|nr:GNAT family N-acetyltransferase [Rummeliibacillus sp. TYF005]RPJ95043.1 GNAT family N-acetyltransferase [Rummeliibacillus sp. TYF005]
MGDVITIGLLSEEDKEATRNVLVASYEQFRDSYTNIEDYYTYIGEIKESLDNPNLDRVLVAKSGEEILGTLQLFLSSELAYGRPEIEIHAPIVRLLGVHPSARGKGIARKLLAESIDYAKQLGANSLYLHTTDKMSDAIRLYEGLGFKRDQEKEFLKYDFLVKCYRFDIESV